VTCIVGIAHEGKVYIGGDSAGVDGRLALEVRADKKVFRNGPFVMGFTSSFRMGNLLQYSLTPPRRHATDEVYKFLVTEFVDAVRKCLKDGGYATAKDGGEAGGTFLLGYEGRLFSVQDDYQVAETISGFDACGSGDQIAKGSLFSTIGQSPQERINVALGAAERFNAGVRAPFAIVTDKD
jgi:ATP-dependent protease HslVU (ClpYQ) peptidase subunit